MPPAGEMGNLLWVALCAMLVMLMQAGFCCLESGCARAKNSAHIALKNLIGFCAASLCFWGVGFAVMFGASWQGLAGHSYFAPGGALPPTLLAFFIFQLVLCGAAVTIISGAVAERIRFSGYLVCSILIAALIYPAFGHWVWGGRIDGLHTGWLNRAGFIDFAGASVVHSMGGWVALAAVLIIGPRLGRFESGRSAIGGNNLALSTLGVFVLWCASFGFNGGSTFKLDGRIPHILINTNLAAAAGGISALVLVWAIERKAIVAPVLNGALGGLVGIAASCHLMSPGAAVQIGIASGAITVVGTYLLESLKIDDVVGAVPVHAFCGVWGTLAVALLADPAGFGTGHTRVEQLLVQIQGAAACFVWAFGAGGIVLAAVNQLWPLRATETAERQGLDVAEHGARDELGELLSGMAEQRARGDFSERIAVEPHSDVGRIADEYNRVLDRVQVEIQAREDSADALRAVTANKQSEQLQIARTASESANHARSAFLGRMSDEISGPLKGVTGMLELMQGTELDPEQQRYVSVARSSSDTLSNLINDVLDLSRIEAGTLELQSVEFQLPLLLEDVAELFSRPARERGLELCCHVLPDVPALVRGDPERLKQILINLVHNALQSTPRGEIVIRASLHDDEGGRAAVRFSVRDTGAGLEPEQRARLFGPVTQPAASATRTPGDSGLGLALCRQLVQLMGGMIDVDSERGRGSLFWCVIPFDKVRSAQRPARDVRDEVRGLKFLAVDAHATNLEILRDQVQSWGGLLLTAPHASSALRLLREAAEAGAPFALALLDQQLPDMDGLELARLIKQDARLQPTRLLMMTSLDSAQVRQRNFSGLVTKPIRQSRLLDAVMSALRDSVPDATAPGSQSARILVADDHDISQLVAAEQLRNAGFDCDLVYSGREVLQALDEQQYDLILLDCQMPELDGFDTAREIRRREAAHAATSEARRVPLIALTANSTLADREQCLAAGMDDCVIKPIDGQLLLSTVQRFLRGAHAEVVVPGEVALETSRDLSPAEAEEPANAEEPPESSPAVATIVPDAPAIAHPPAETAALTHDATEPPAELSSLAAPSATEPSDELATCDIQGRDDDQGNACNLTATDSVALDQTVIEFTLDVPPRVDIVEPAAVAVDRNDSATTVPASAVESTALDQTVIEFTLDVPTKAVEPAAAASVDSVAVPGLIPSETAAAADSSGNPSSHLPAALPNIGQDVPIDADPVLAAAMSVEPDTDSTDHPRAERGITAGSFLVNDAASTADQSATTSPLEAVPHAEPQPAETVSSPEDDLVRQVADILQETAQFRMEEVGLTPPIDQEALLDRCLGDADFRTRILEKFRTRVPHDLEQINAAVERESIPDIRRLSHNLKGSAANVSAKALSRAAGELEDAAHLPASQVRAAQRRLDGEVTRCTRYLDVLLAAEQVPPSEAMGDFRT